MTAHTVDGHDTEPRFALLRYLLTLLPTAATLVDEHVRERLGSCASKPTGSKQRERTDRVVHGIATDRIELRIADALERGPALVAPASVFKQAA